MTKAEIQHAVWKGTAYYQDKKPGSPRMFIKAVREKTIKKQKRIQIRLVVAPAYWQSADAERIFNEEVGT